MMTELAIKDPLMAALQEEIDAIDASAALAKDRHDGVDFEWLVDWYLQKLTEFTSVENLVQDQAQTMLGHVMSRRKALAWRHGKAFEAECRKLYDAREDKTRKSVDTLAGRIGCRTTGGRQRLVIDDEVAAIAAAEMKCPDAVRKTLSKSALIEHLEAGFTIDGARLEQTDKTETFYAGGVNFDTPALEGPKDD